MSTKPTIHHSPIDLPTTTPIMSAMFNHILAPASACTGDLLCSCQRCLILKATALQKYTLLQQQSALPPFTIPGHISPSLHSQLSTHLSPHDSDTAEDFRLFTTRPSSSPTRWDNKPTAIFGLFIWIYIYILFWVTQDIHSFQFRKTACVIYWSELSDLLSFQ